MIELTVPDETFLEKQLEDFRVSHTHSELNPVWAAVGYRPNAIPRTIKVFLDELEQFRIALGSMPRQNAVLALDQTFAPLIKLILFTQRRVIAADLDRRKATTDNPEIMGSLDSELAPFDEMLDRPWLKDVTPRRMLRMADYLTLEQVEKNLRERGVELPKRQYDEKFHLLQAPALLLPDVEYYRTVGAARGISLALAYVDIDDFKSLNTAHGHSRVDVDVLPPFMRALEAFTFARGHAYRFGGDEYVLLLANGQGAATSLQSLQEELLRLSYREISEKTSISVGLCEVTPDCFLSNQAIVERANRAMRYAKESAKGRIVTYTEGRYRDEDLVVVPGASVEAVSAT